MSTTDAHWKRWAEQDPYHGVLGRGFGVGDIERPNVRAEFFRQGEAHVQRVLDLAKLLGACPEGSALDFGCGVGRLLLPLLSKFNSVTGVDIAPRMLELARQNCGEPNRLSLETSLDSIESSGRQYDLVHSYIVLQHINPAVGLEIIKRLAVLAKPGGVVALHFTVGDLDRRRWWLNQLRYRVPPLHWLYNITTGRTWNLPISEMNAYPVHRVLAVFRKHVSSDFTGWAVDQGGHQGMMLIAIKQKA